MSISLALNFVLGDIILKNLVARPRPYSVSEELLAFLKSINFDLLTSYSFPSGHASSSFAVATALYLYNKKWGKPAMIFASIIAYSRVYMCVHYLSDIVAGATLGIIVAYSVYNFFKFLCYTKQKRCGIINLNLLKTNKLCTPCTK